MTSSRSLKNSKTDLLQQTRRPRRAPRRLMFPVLLFQIPLAAEEQEVEEKVEEEVQQAPKKRARKPQAYDRKGQPCSKRVSEAANTGSNY